MQNHAKKTAKTAKIMVKFMAKIWKNYGKFRQNHEKSVCHPSSNQRLSFRLC